MKKGEKQKMCTQCDARLPLDSDICIYCGSKVDSGSGSWDRTGGSAVRMGSLESPYKPPYPSRLPELSREQEELSPSSGREELASRNSQEGFDFRCGQEAFASRCGQEEPFRHDSNSTEREDPLTQAVRAVAMPEETHERKNALLASGSLLLASYLLLLGLLQLLFSEGGKLRLEWSTDYWYIYCLAALPLVYLGYKKLES